MFGITAMCSYEPGRFDVGRRASMQLIEVLFKGNRKEFFSWEHEDSLAPRMGVIVEVDRGEDFGRVHTVGGLAERRCSGCGHGCAATPPMRKVLRIATTDEERRVAELRTQDEEARRRAMDRVKVHGLVMKLSDAEWQWDRKKLTFYFTAEKRVDFRGLVRDLAATFRTRIELKQIGVRDEAKRLSGIGRCGREYCSAVWLPELRPVNLQVAKDQRLSLNPSQISGACGRLMCSLRFEHEFYVSARKRFPSEGRVLVTGRGEERVLSIDIFKDRVTLRSADGEVRVVPLAELKREIEALAPFPSASSVDAVAVDRDGGAESAGGAVAGSEEGEDEVAGEDDVAAEVVGGSMDEVAADDVVAEVAGHAGVRPAESSSGPYPGARRRGRRGGRRSRPSGDEPRDRSRGNGSGA